MAFNFILTFSTSVTGVQTQQPTRMDDAARLFARSPFATMLAALIKQLLGLSLDWLSSLFIAAFRYVGIDDASRRHQEENATWIAAIRKVVDAVPRHPRDLHRDLPVEILPHLLLGDKRSASSPFILQASGVTHILNVAGSLGATDNGRALGEGCYLQIHADDEEGYPMLRKHYDAASAFIRKARASGGKCLIHCQAGINRSGIIATAELMVDQRLPVVDAVKRAKSARGVILTNRSFQEELVAFAREHELLGQMPDDVEPAEVEAAKSRRPPPPPPKDALRRLG